MKRKKPRIIVIVLVTVAIVATMIMTILPDSSRTMIADYFGRVFDPVTSFFYSMTDNVSDFFTAVSKNKELKEEVAILKKENFTLQEEVKINQEKVEAYDKLEEALNLKSKFQDHEIIGGMLLNQSIGPMFDLFRINLGREDGLLVSSDRTYPVLDSQHNLVGRLYSTDLTSSRVLPLLHEGFSASCKLEAKEGANFRVRGSVEYKDKSLCVLDQFEEGTAINKGDTVITSGEGGLFPEGIVLGTVAEVFRDEQAQNIKALVEPACNFSELEYVFILVDSLSKAEDEN